MKRTILMVPLLSVASSTLLAQSNEHQKGTIIRMRMAECMPQHNFMTHMSGGAGVGTPVLCPEYVLMRDKVVYAISGKSSNQLLPLAEITKFRLKDGEVLIRIDDERKESRFRVKAMLLRTDWEREHMAVEELRPVVAQPQDDASIAANHR